MILRIYDVCAGNLCTFYNLKLWLSSKFKIFYIVKSFRYHPHFKNVMQSRISQLMGIDYKFDLMLSEDGSGRGAALVAAVLKRGEDGNEGSL